MLTVTQLKNTLEFDRKSGLFQVDFEGFHYKQRFCEFIATVQYLKSVDLAALLIDVRGKDDIRVPLSCKGSSITIDLHHLSRFFDLYSVAMFEIHLQDLLSRNKISFAS